MIQFSRIRLVNLRLITIDKQFIELLFHLIVSLSFGLVLFALALSYPILIIPIFSLVTVVILLSNWQLRLALQKARSELQKIRAESKRTNPELCQFVTNKVHDIANLLTVISLSLEQSKGKRLTAKQTIKDLAAIGTHLKMLGRAVNKSSKV